MQGTTGLVPTLAAQGATALLWVCIAILIALSLILVLVSIIFGGNRSGRSAAARTRKEEGVGAEAFTEEH
jgi:hypothetical protein